MIVVGDEVTDLGLQITWQIVILQQDAVLQRLVPALDLALGLRMERRATDMIDAMVFEPFRQVTGNVARARCRSAAGGDERPWLARDPMLGGPGSKCR